MRGGRVGRICMSCSIVERVTVTEGGKDWSTESSRRTHEKHSARPGCRACSDCRRSRMQLLLV